MALLELAPINPEIQSSSYDYQIDLGDVTYRLVIRYNTRSDRWYLSLYDAENNLLISGVKLVINYPLLSNHLSAPSGGTLILIDTANTGEECGYEDLGRRCQLLWWPEEDYPATESTETLIIEVT